MTDTDRHGQTLMMQYDSYVSELADRDRDLTHMQLEGKYSLEFAPLLN